MCLKLKGKKKIVNFLTAKNSASFIEETSNIDDVISTLVGSLDNS